MIIRDRLPDVDLVEVLQHVRGLVTAAEAGGRTEEAEWWRAQYDRWATDPAVARAAQTEHEAELRANVDPATVEAFARECIAADAAGRDRHVKTLRRLRRQWNER